MQFELKTLDPQILILDQDALKMVGGFDWFGELRNHQLFNRITTILLYEKNINNADLQKQAKTYQVKALDMPVDMSWLRGYLSATFEE